MTMQLRKPILLRVPLFVVLAVAASVLAHSRSAVAADSVDLRSAVATVTPHVLTVHFETASGDLGLDALSYFVEDMTQMAIGTDESGSPNSDKPGAIYRPTLPLADRLPGPGIKQSFAIPAEEPFRIIPPIVDPNRRAGIVVSSDLVITDNLPDDADGIQVELTDGSMIACQIVCRDRVSGLVAMRVETPFDTSISLASETPQIGQPLAVVTRDRHGNPQVRQAIAATDVNWPTRTGFIQRLDGRLEGLHAGSPVVDVNGSLTGVLVKTPPDASITSPYAGAGPTLSCLPLANVRRLMQSAESGSPTDLVRGRLGIQLGGKTESFVRSLQPDSAAADAGMQARDVVKRVGDYDVRTTDQVVAAAASYRAGDAITVTVQRDDALVELEIVLAGVDKDLIAKMPSQGTKPARRAFTQAFMLKDGQLVPLDPSNTDPLQIPPGLEQAIQLQGKPLLLSEILPGMPIIGRLPGTGFKLNGMKIERSEMENNVRKLEQQLRSNSQQLDSISKQLQQLLDK